MPSTVHAVVVSVLCIFALCYSGDFFDSAMSGSSSSSSNAMAYDSSAAGSSSSSLPLVLRVSPVSFAIIGISFGYFVMDGLLLSTHPEIATREMAVHHAVALLSLVVAAHVSAMHVYLMLVLVTELTTPVGEWNFLQQGGVMGEGVVLHWGPVGVAGHSACGYERMQDRHIALFFPRCFKLLSSVCVCAQAGCTCCLHLNPPYCCYCHCCCSEPALVAGQGRSEAPEAVHHQRPSAAAGVGGGTCRAVCALLRACGSQLGEPGCALCESSSVLT